MEPRDAALPFHQPEDLPQALRWRSDSGSPKVERVLTWLVISLGECGCCRDAIVASAQRGGHDADYDADADADVGRHDAFADVHSGGVDGHFRAGRASGAVTFDTNICAHDDADSPNAAAAVVVDRMLPVAFLMSFVGFFYAFMGFIVYRDEP